MQPTAAINVLGDIDIIIIVVSVITIIIIINLIIIITIIIIIIIIIIVIVIIVMPCLFLRRLFVCYLRYPHIIIVSEVSAWFWIFGTFVSCFVDCSEPSRSNIEA